MTIEVLQKLGLQGGLQFLNSDADFPINPDLGTMILKDKCIYVYLEVAGLETWYPFASRTTSYIHTQGAPSTIWNINHGLSSLEVWFQVKDSDGKIINAPVTVIDENNIQVKFTYPVKGTCIVVAAQSIDVPQVKASVISVGNASQVVINSSGVFVNGQQVLTSASIEQQISDAIAPKADKTYVDTQLDLKADKATTYTKTEVNAISTNIIGSGSTTVGYDTIIGLGSKVQSAETNISTIQSNIAGIQSTLSSDVVLKSSIGTNSGVAGLDSSGKIPSTQLPSYVDDVLEYADLSSLPVTGETGKIYVALDTNKTYRWSGSTYTEISAGEVASVNGHKGIVVLDKTDIGLSNVDNKSSATIRSEITSGNVTSALGYTPVQANSDIIAGTGTKITYDSKGLVTGSASLTSFDIPDLSATYQPKSNELTGIVNIAGTVGLVKKTATGTYTLDNNTYLTGNQSISVSGDATGSGTTSIALTLANSGVTAGTYKSVTVDAKGRVTSGTNPTTLSAYGITDGVTKTYADSLVTVPGNGVEISNLLGAYRHFSSSSVTDGCDITINGDGTISFSSGEVTIRISDVDDATLTTLQIPASGTLTPTDNDVTYYYVDYNSGSPVWATATSISGFNGLTKVQAWVVTRRGTRIHAIDFRAQAVDGNRKTRRLLLEASGSNQGGFWHTRGSSTLSGSGLALQLTSGKFYYGLAPITHTAFDTSVDGTADSNVFDYYYNRTTWTYTANAKTIDNTNYDNAGVLTTMINGRYRTDWIYLVHGNTPRLVAIMGNAQYTSLALAQSAPLPSSLPGWIDGASVLIGQVVILKGATTLTVQSAFTTGFSGAVASDHNTLGNLQGGTANEYYHITSTQATAVANLSGTNTGDQTITLTGDVTGSGTGSFATTLANSGVTAGTYTSVTVNAKGLVTAGTSPTTLSGYGITDAQSKLTSSVISTATTAIANKLYVITASLTLTLPASPTTDDIVKVVDMSNSGTVVIAANGKNIMAAANDITLDVSGKSLTLHYVDATRGWVIY